MLLNNVEFVIAGLSKWDENAKNLTVFLYG